jgi:hypothetical protein
MDKVEIHNNGIYKNGEQLWEAAPELELNDFLRAGYDRFSGQYPKFHKMDPLSKLGWLGAEVLLQGADLLSRHTPDQVGLVLANRSASLDTDLRYYDSVSDIPSPALFVYTLPNIVIGEICIRHGFKGENAFFTSERFDREMMMHYTQQLLDENALSACIMGWVEVMGQQYEVKLELIEKVK